MKFQRAFALAVLVPIQIGCVTMGKVAEKRDGLLVQRSEWVANCIKVAKSESPNISMDRRLERTLENKLKNVSSMALKSLNQHNCRSNVLWYSFTYPDCLVEAEKSLEALVSSSCSPMSEIVAEAKDKAKQENVKQNEAKKVAIERKLTIEKELKFVDEIESQKATHVIVGFLALNGSIKPCTLQLDGSFLCDKGVICNLDTYRKILKSALNDGEYPNFLNNCELNDAPQNDFLLVTKTEIRFNDYIKYVRWMRVPDARGANGFIKTRMGATLPAATWVQKGPIFDANSGVSVAH